jgi:glycosyltransferase involved in cell wall biosynthesis
MRVHQMVARMETGDAVSNQALAIHRVLRGWGVESRIFAHDMEAPCRHVASLDDDYRPFMNDPEDLLIYHFSIYCENYRIFLKSRNRKMLVYHNITPAEFFEGFFQQAAEHCRQGRELLPLLKDCDLGVGVSDFNRRELVAAGFEEEKTRVLPILPPVDRLDSVAPDRDQERRFGDGKVNFLFVGRVVPNKRVEDIIKLFYAYHRGVNACSRLLVAGTMLSTYCSALQSMVDGMGLEERVHFLGKVGDPALKSLYGVADYYVSMSEHEGFCVPLLEAFHFGVPVLAYDAGAVAETMGGAGVLFEEKDHQLLAEFVDRLERDSFLRGRIVEAQRARLEEFSIEGFKRALGALIAELFPVPVAEEGRREAEEVGA